MAATMKKIAELAGVSMGTVDRALHNRGRVNPDVAQRIQQIAKELNYKPNSIAKSLYNRNKKFKITVILHIESHNPYFDDVSKGIEKCQQELSDFGVTIETKSCPDFDATEQLKLINQAIQEETSAIAIVPINHPTIKTKINELHQSGFPVILLSNIIDQCDFLSFVGCNYKLSGEITAGLLNMVHSGAGKLLLFSPSFHMMGHTLRAQGLKQQLAEHYTAISLQKTCELTGDNIKDYQITMKSLEKYPDTDLIVCPGAYSHGNLQALEEAGFFKKAKVICYDYSNSIRKYIENRDITATIVQNPQDQGYIAVKLLFEHLTGNHLIPIQKYNYIPTKIYFYENLCDLN